MPVSSDFIPKSKTYPASINTIHIGEKPNSISFSGCGFLGVYHIGVASCLQTHAPNWVKSLDRVYGCSAGSLIAAMLANEIPMDEVCRKTMHVVQQHRSHYLGAFHPGFQLSEIIRRDLQAGLPVDAHIRSSGKLFISMTRFRDRKNVIVSQYDTRDELIDAILCSCFVPLYSGFFIPKFKGERYIDGGLSNNLPAFEDTVTVSPWAGSSDICPRYDGMVSLLDVNIYNTSIQVTASNIYRCLRMFFPSSEEVLKDFCSQAFRETVQYLREHGLFETMEPLRKNFSFSAELHKTEHRRNLTRRLSCTARSLYEKDLSEADGMDDGPLQMSFSSIPDDTTDEVPARSQEESFHESNEACNKNFPDEKKQDKSCHVFTVIHAYPIENDPSIRVRFSLPTPLLEALEAALNRNRSPWSKPLSVVLWACQAPTLVFRIPLQKSYAIARFLLRHSASFPEDVQWLVKYLKELVRELHVYLNAVGGLVLEKLIGNVALETNQTVKILSEKLAVVDQLLIRSLLCQAQSFYPSWLPSLVEKYFLLPSKILQTVK